MTASILGSLISSQISLEVEVVQACSLGDLVSADIIVGKDGPRTP